MKKKVGHFVVVVHSVCSNSTKMLFPTIFETPYFLYFRHYRFQNLDLENLDHAPLFSVKNKITHFAILGGKALKLA